MNSALTFKSARTSSASRTSYKMAKWMAFEQKLAIARHSRNNPRRAGMLGEVDIQENRRPSSKHH
ncbi:hypothetical protein PI125_g2859 [Phytophthora idaei]|nr:hypothetical protein PI125_g2859 [Phytophthora idaei]